MSSAAADRAAAGKPPEHDLLIRLQTIDEMVRANEEAERRLERIAERRRIPPVPDLRFEYSYVRSVAPYVHVERTTPEVVPVEHNEKGKAKALSEAEVTTNAPSRATEVVRVDWDRILWVTMRDQVISPLVQGALWGVASHFLRPLGAVLGTHIRAWWGRGDTRVKEAHESEGNGVQWLRNRMGAILAASVPSNPSALHVR
ncbi:hypothetical protein BD414DRAFT_502658 [Trametes punicea]|nr:hypothetical protein BD414DRAFT_502658 [Trametes punicea]